MSSPPRYQVRGTCKYGHASKVSGQFTSERRSYIFATYAVTTIARTRRNEANCGVAQKLGMSEYAERFAENEIRYKTEKSTRAGLGNSQAMWTVLIKMKPRGARQTSRNGAPSSRIEVRYA